jgi:UDP-N-acetylglucosamine:LPS N-acetylglucosamine transferase
LRGGNSDTKNDELELADANNLLEENCNADDFERAEAGLSLKEELIIAASVGKRIGDVESEEARLISTDAADAADKLDGDEVAFDESSCC